MGVTKSAEDGSTQKGSVEPINEAQADDKRSRRKSTSEPEDFEQTGNFFSGAIKLGKSALKQNLQHQRDLRNQRNAQHAANMSQWRADQEKSLAEFEQQAAKKRMKAEELGASLLKELREEVVARYEKECVTEVREEVLRNRKTIEDNVRSSIAVEVRQELYQELEPVISSELAKDMYNPVKKALQIDLKDKVIAQLHDKLYHVVRAEIEAQLRVDLYPIVRKEIEQRIVSEFSGEIKRLGHPDWLEGLNPNVEKQLPSEQQSTAEATAAIEARDGSPLHNNGDDYQQDRGDYQQDQASRDGSPLYVNRDDYRQDRASLSPSLLAQEEEEESLFLPQEPSDDDDAAELEEDGGEDDVVVEKVQEINVLDPRLAWKRSGDRKDVKGNPLPDHEKSEASEVQETGLGKENEEAELQESDNSKVQAVFQDEVADELTALPNGADSLGQDAQQGVENTQIDLKSDQTEYSPVEAIHTREADGIPSSNALKDAESAVQQLQSTTAKEEVQSNQGSSNFESHAPKFSAQDGNYRDRKRSLSSEGSDDDVDRAYKRIRPEGTGFVQTGFVQTKKRDRDTYEDDREPQQSIEETIVESKLKRRCTAFESDSESSLDDKEEDRVSETSGDHVGGHVEGNEPASLAENAEEEFDEEEDGEGYDDEDEDDYEGEEAEEDEEYETAPNNHHQANQSAAVITETNTQETAFVIDDSDEEDAEADPEQTLIGSPTFTSINKHGDMFQEGPVEEEEAVN